MNNKHYKLEYDFGELTILGKPERIEPIEGLTLKRAIELIENSAINTQLVNMKWSIKITREEK